MPERKESQGVKGKRSFYTFHSFCHATVEATVQVTYNRTHLAKQCLLLPNSSFRRFADNDLRLVKHVSCVVNVINVQFQENYRVAWTEAIKFIEKCPLAGGEYKNALSILTPYALTLTLNCIVALAEV